MSVLHEKQLAILRYLTKQYLADGVEVRATLRELGVIIGVRSAGQTAFHVRKLEALGHIERIARSSYIVPFKHPRVDIKLTKGKDNE